MAINVSISGLDNLKLELLQLDDKFKSRSLKKVLKNAAKPLITTMKANAPKSKINHFGRYFHLMGNLRYSIDMRYGKNKNNPVVYVGPNRKKGVDAYYYWMVIVGTQAHEIKAKKGSTLTFASKGKKIQVQRVMNKGIKANPFVKKSYDMSQDTVMKMLEVESLKEIKRIWKQRKTA